MQKAMNGLRANEAAQWFSQSRLLITLQYYFELQHLGWTIPGTEAEQVWCKAMFMLLSMGHSFQDLARTTPVAILFFAGVMATLLHPETRRLYSWWWDSHIPKNSKWLQEDLTEMDAKVKAMIKLTEEDADSFARRAEMYYEKRPKLMKLVEEFHRAYRAQAERYDHVIDELRQAQKTMSEAFPNQLPFLWMKIHS